MANHIEINESDDGRESYVETMMGLHGISREKANNWWEKRKAHWRKGMRVYHIKRRQEVPDQQSDTDSAGQVIPFTGTHPNEDDPPDAA